MGPASNAPLDRIGFVALMKNVGVTEARARKIWELIVPDRSEETTLIKFINLKGQAAPEGVTPREWKKVEGLITFLETDHGL